MAAVGLQESGEAIVPRATSRANPEGLTTREGLNLAGRTRPSVVLSRGDEADWLSPGQRSLWQRKSGCSIRQDCQEPRWLSGTRMSGGVGGGGRNPPADPIRPPVYHTISTGFWVLTLFSNAGMRS